MKEIRLFSEVQFEHRSQVCRLAGSAPVASLCPSDLLPKLCKPLAGHKCKQCQEVFAKEYREQCPFRSLPEDWNEGPAFSCEIFSYWVVKGERLWSKQFSVTWLYITWQTTLLHFQSSNSILLKVKISERFEMPTLLLQCCAEHCRWVYSLLYSMCVEGNVQGGHLNFLFFIPKVVCFSPSRWELLSVLPLQCHFKKSPKHSQHT